MADIENKNNNIKPDSYPQYSNIKGLDLVVPLLRALVSWAIC